MEAEKLKPAIEAILFACGTPAELTKIAQALEIKEEKAEELLKSLMEDYSSRKSGIKIVRLGKSYQMCTEKEYAEIIRTVLDLRRNSPLSQAALEVLAIIAYNQPVTKAFVEQIRGVDCSGVVSSLVARELIEEKGRLDNLTIGFCGDLKFGRTVHSLIKAMSRYSNVKFILIAPKELAIPDYIKTDILDKSGSEYKEVETMEEAMPQLDVLYMTRVQRERFFSEDEYLKVKDAFILDLEKLNTAKEDLTIMHPLPRVNEIATEVDDDPRAKYFVQALNGKYVRMALIKTLLEWAGTL